MTLGILTAFRTLSIFPLPGKEQSAPARSLIWFPLVGVVLGTLAAGLLWVLPTTPILSAFFLLCFLVLSTGALHLDGLADMADGIFGGRTPERRLEIMKDPRLGSFGGIALVLVLLGKAVALWQIAQKRAFLVLLLALLLSRLGMALLAAFGASARPGGTAHPFLAESKARHGLATVGLAGILILTLVGWPGLWLLPAVALLAWGFGLWAKAKIGGLTGDLLGGWNELAELSLLLALPAWPWSLHPLLRGFLP